MSYKFNSTDCIISFFAFVAIFACSRHVILPKELADKVPRTHLMTESEWRNLGVQQSPGWTHYLIHEPGKIFKVSNELIKSITVKNLLLFQRKAYSQIAVWDFNLDSLFLGGCRISRRAVPEFFISSDDWQNSLSSRPWRASYSFSK